MKASAKIKLDISVDVKHGERLQDAVDRIVAAAKDRVEELVTEESVRVTGSALVDKLPHSSLADKERAEIALHHTLRGKSKTIEEIEQDHSLEEIELTDGDRENILRAARCCADTYTLGSSDRQVTHIVLSKDEVVGTNTRILFAAKRERPAKAKSSDVLKIPLHIAFALYGLGARLFVRRNIEGGAAGEIAELCLWSARTEKLFCESYNCGIGRLDVFESYKKLYEHIKKEKSKRVFSSVPRDVIERSVLNIGEDGYPAFDVGIGEPLSLGASSKFPELLFGDTVVVSYNAGSDFGIAVFYNGNEMEYTSKIFLVAPPA